MIPGTGNRDTLPTNVRTKATEFPQRDGTVLYGIQVLRPIATWVDFTRNGKLDLYTDKQARDDMQEYLRKLPNHKKCD